VVTRPGRSVAGRNERRPVAIARPEQAGARVGHVYQGWPMKTPAAFAPSSPRIGRPRGGEGGSRSKLKTADPERKVEPCLGLYRQRLQDKRALEAAN
jgi:hypothetical protein